MTNAVSESAPIRDSIAKGLIIGGIGTGVGKTLVSSIVVRALQADYWKPVQSGIDPVSGFDPDGEPSDTQTVRTLSGLTDDHFHKEVYSFALPASPHAAAAAEDRSVDVSEMVLPASERPLIIEGVGGWLVPLNDAVLFADWAARIQLPVLLVSQNYLGSINHTLMTVEALLNRNMDIAGIVFNGEEVPSTESFILNYCGLRQIGRIPTLKSVTPEAIADIAEHWKSALREITGT